MYRPFKETINARFQDWCRLSAPAYKAVKSLARGGGVTLRKRATPGRSHFLILQHVVDRDLVSLTGGWAAAAWFADWNAAETDYYYRLGPSERAAFVEMLNTTPGRLLDAQSEGIYIASHIDSSIVMHELEVGDGGVPYELIAGLDLEDPAIRANVEMFLGPAITDSLAAGHVPPLAAPNPSLGLHAAYPIRARLLSWECWFEHVLGRRPTDEELTALCGPVVDELSRQAGLLMEVARKMEQPWQGAIPGK